MERSAKKVHDSVKPAQLEAFRKAYKLVMAHELCPIDPERPHFQAMFEREARLKAVLDGKTADNIIEAGARIQSLLDAERASMRELSFDSPMGKEINAAARRYLDEVPEGADNFSAMFPFWTRARVAYASALKPAGSALDVLPDYEAPAPHQRDLSGLLLYGDGWLKKLKVVRILASPTKAYVFLGDPEKSMRTTFHRDEGEWKVHSDLFGYPWSQESTEAVDCIEH